QLAQGEAQPELRQSELRRRADAGELAEGVHEPPHVRLPNELDERPRREPERGPDEPGLRWTGRAIDAGQQREQAGCRRLGMEMEPLVVVEDERPPVDQDL